MRGHVVATAMKTMQADEAPVVDDERRPRARGATSNAALAAELGQAIDDERGAGREDHAHEVDEEDPDARLREGVDAGDEARAREERAEDGEEERERR